MERPSLSDFERELLELCAPASNMGETTTSLYEEVSSEKYDRAALEAALRGLVARDLMTTSRGIFAGRQRLRSGRTIDCVYEDDWWVLTDSGRAAIGMPPRTSSLDQAQSKDTNDS